MATSGLARRRSRKSSMGKLGALLFWKSSQLRFPLRSWSPQAMCPIHGKVLGRLSPIPCDYDKKDRYPISRRPPFAKAPTPGLFQNVPRDRTLSSGKVAVGDTGIGIHRIEGHEGPMIESPLGFVPHRKSSIIVKPGRMGSRHHREFRFFPMAGYRQYLLGLHLQLTGPILEAGIQSVVHAPVLAVQPRPSPGAYLNHNSFSIRIRPIPWGTT